MYRGMGLWRCRGVWVCGVQVEVCGFMESTNITQCPVEVCECACGYVHMPAARPHSNPA